MTMVEFRSIDFKETWNSLQKLVKCVLTDDPFSSEEWIDGFFHVYSICVAPSASPLYLELYDSTKLVLEARVLELLNITLTGGNENLLQNYYTNWQKYSTSVKQIHVLYQYFNRLQISHTISRHRNPRLNNSPIISNGLMQIGWLGFDTWKNNMIEPLKESMHKLLLDWFEKQRRNLSMNTPLDLIAGVINSFVAVQEFNNSYPLELYQTYFEQAFLEQCSENFKREAAQWLQEFTVSEYIVKVLEALKALKEEEIRFKHFLHESTYQKVRLEFSHHMIDNHLEFLLEEIKVMTKEERRDDMRNIYLLLSEDKDKKQRLVHTFQEHIMSHATKIIELSKQEQSYVQFVEAVSALNVKYSKLVLEVFENDTCISGVLDTALTKIINYKSIINQPSKSPEYLSKYYDNLLKKSPKGMGEGEIENKLLSSVTIFKYIEDKDVFQRLYQRDLGNRLIHQRIQSMDREEGMINKLKRVCGNEFTNKLSQMFTDIRVSEELNTKFHNELLKNGDQLKIDFSTFVLQTGAWNFLSSSVKGFVIPKQLIPCIQHFDEFYKGSFNGRSLTWLFDHCEGELKINYLEKPYVVTMHTFQMAILLLFEERDTLKYTEIDGLIKLNTEHFKKNINSLVDSKLLMIEGENVTLNKSYTNERTKLRITLQKDTNQEIEQAVVSVDKDRKAYLQGAIVRIMKARKLLCFNELVKEILSQSQSFVPSIALIQTSIKTLIDRGYLKRTPNYQTAETETYSYVA